VRLLLDAHALLWWLADDPSLSKAAREAIASASNHVAVSAITVWEIGIKQALGKLDAPADLVETIETSGFDGLPVTMVHGAAASRLVRHHDDPFDRMLIAQAQAEGLTVVTRDEAIGRYGVAILAA
jgi:PIN domain nuclease of toxin-antitoxin system